MEFLAPWFLVAAAAAAIPLVLHLLRRRIRTRREFPAVRYLARAERENSRKLRLRNLLLMLLRVAAVLLIVLAAARPVARVVGSGHAPTALAIVLDNSLSTSAIVDGHPVLDDLRARARAVAQRASAGDKLWLVTADGVVRGGDRNAIVDAIAHTEALSGAGDPALAAARGATLVRGASAVAREVTILTDAQATSWPEPLSLGNVRVLAYRPRADPPRNHAVTEADASPSRWTPSGAVRARVLTPDSGVYRITLEGRTLARGTATKDEEVVVHATPAERGWIDGAVELEPDELRGDDVRRFAVWIGPAPAVGVSPTLGIFARSAVGALVTAQRVTLGGDIAVVPADEATRLPALLIAPADPRRAGAANRALEHLGIPWRLGAMRQGGESTVRSEGGDSASSTTAAFRGVTVARRYVLERRPGAAADTLVAVSGAPWIVAGVGYVLIASPLVPEATTLPVRAAFVPWLGDVLSQRLSDEIGSLVGAAPGAAIARPARADGLELPGGQHRALSGDTIAAPRQTGVYFFTQGQRRIGALVVNPEAKESVLDRLDRNALAARLHGRDVQVMEDGPALEAGVLSSAPRRPMVMPLLVLALAVLLVESAIVGTGRRRAAP